LQVGHGFLQVARYPHRRVGAAHCRTGAHNGVNTGMFAQSNCGIAPVARAVLLPPTLCVVTGPALVAGLSPFETRFRGVLVSLLLNAD
jgi:hypothetical protein